MDKQFWLDKWQARQIPFHNSEFHPRLVKYLPTFDLPESPRTLVPLCGKSLDMFYLLSQGHHVVAVEFSQHAIEEFFNENSLGYSRENLGELIRFSSDAIDLYCGDFFHLSSEIIGAIDFVYDRACYIALPPKMRKNYIKHLKELTYNKSQLMVINFEYDKEKQGPPFNVSFDEVKSVYENIFNGKVEILDEWQEEMRSDQNSHLIGQKVISIKMI